MEQDPYSLGTLPCPKGMDLPVSQSKMEQVPYKIGITSLQIRIPKMYGTSLRNKDRYRNGTKIHTKWARNGTTPDENSMASRQPALRGGKIHTKWGRNAIQNGKGLRRTLQCRKKIDTKMGEGQYEKGTIWEKARQRTALQGQRSIQKWNDTERDQAAGRMASQQMPLQG